MEDDSYFGMGTMMMRRQGAGRLAVYPGYIGRGNGSGHANGADAQDIYYTTIGSVLLADDMLWPCA